MAHLPSPGTPMSDRNLIRLVAVALLALGVLFVVELRAQREYRADSAARLMAMQSTVDGLDREMTEMQLAIAELQKHSVKNVMGRANDAVVQGFSSLMGTLRDELEQLSDMLDDEASGDGPAAGDPNGSGDTDEPDIDTD